MFKRRMSALWRRQGGRVLRRNPMRLLALLLLLLCGDSFFAQDPGRNEVPGQPIRAFAPPEQDAVEAAIRQVIILAVIAGCGLGLLVIGLWYYYIPVVNFIRGREEVRHKAGGKGRPTGEKPSRPEPSPQRHEGQDEDGRWVI